MRLMPLLLIAACTGSTDDGPKYVEETGDTYVPWPDDTDSPGTDADGDGVTVEDGDCDDTNIYVNPRRDEDLTDDIDNDCDGRIDEQFRGLVIVQQGDGDTAGRILGTDDFGSQVAWEVMLDDPNLLPVHLTRQVSGDGWVIGIAGSYDPASEIQIALYNVDASGNTSLLADFSDAELYPYGIFGIATNPEGSYYVVTGDALFSVDAQTGAVSNMATWDVETELIAYDVAVDEITGEGAVFDYYGGFASITPSGQVQTLRTMTPDEIGLQGGIRRDDGGWYAGGQDADGWGIFRFRFDDASWVRQLEIAPENPTWNMKFFTTDDVNGGYFVSLTEAAEPSVYRVSEAGGVPSTFYLSDLRDNDFAMWDLYTVY